MTDDPHEGAEYQHEDGTIEVVIAIQEGRVLTMREYTEVDRFRQSIAEATDRGTNPIVEEISLDVFGEERDRE